jgi:hypothetical protein
MGRPWVWFSIAGAAVAAAVLALQVVVPLMQGWGFVWPADYYLAMGHSVNAGIPYPFFWSPVWEYWLGALTPLIAAGGLLAFVVGNYARRAGSRVAAIPMVIGAFEVIAFLGGFAISAAWFGHGVAV